MEYFRQRFFDELNDEGNINIRGFEWPPAEVFKSMSPNDFNSYFVEWLGYQRLDAKNRAKDFLIKSGCLGRFNRLHTQLGSRSVIPFVGAGMSRTSGFPLWGEFLESLTLDYPNTIVETKELVACSHFEEAAQLLFDRMGDVVFSEAIQNTFGTRNRPLKGPVQLLPFVFTESCITTNFDYVLERVYDDNAHRFQQVYSGRQLRESLQRLALEPRLLLHVHGEAESGHGRVLTQAEYQTQYSQETEYRELLRGLIANRSLLFLGCSLSADRTLQALQEIKGSAQIETPRHYAFLPLLKTTDREARRRELGDADIHPIWYPADNQDQAVEDLLISLIDGGLHE